ncbi:hypothetical protein MMC25_000142 [Agyrium rufum]|nr:hypothetical protein [Agyrium rufum]
MPFFSKVFKNKDGTGRKNEAQNGVIDQGAKKPKWDDAWMRKEVEPEEVQELIRGCIFEVKARALDMPFLLLPFRPASDPSAARSFIRNFFGQSYGNTLSGERLSQELLLTEPMVLCSVLKWCWSRLAGGVVTWESYELFRLGEKDSDMARDAFATFIPLSVPSESKSMIIFDFFDLMSAIAAHAKTNGMTGRKLSRLAGWWAFEQVDVGNAFEAGYNNWATAADAASHLFFAYLRSLSPDTKGAGGFNTLPISLRTLLQATEYPPERPILMQTSTYKVAMIVDTVSPTPFSLLRRAKHFQYRDDDRALQRFSEFEDPIQALTDECRRVLNSISSVNDSSISNSQISTSLKDASWSRFEDIGFGGLSDEDVHEDRLGLGQMNKSQSRPQGLRTTSSSKTTDLGRPTTPSWADFLSTGFVNEVGEQAPSSLLLPPDKILPPINTRGHSSHSHRRPLASDTDLEPGELASIITIDLDDAFWWVWITSLAGEETAVRKAAFGRCAVIETSIRGGRWLVMEEIVKGAAPEPDPRAHIAEKQGFFSFGKKSRINRTKSQGRQSPMPVRHAPYQRNTQASPLSKTSIAPDQQAKIQAAAAALQQKQQPLPRQPQEALNSRRGRMNDAASTKTNSVFTLQPVIMSEAATGMQWANSYDKGSVRAAYLGNELAGTGTNVNQLDPRGPGYGEQRSTNESIAPTTPPKTQEDLTQAPPVPRKPSGPSIGNTNTVPDAPVQAPPMPPASDAQGAILNSDPPMPQNTGDDVPARTEPRSPTVERKPVAPSRLSDIMAMDEAASVPLPAPTPMEYPRPMERSETALVQPPKEQTPIPEPVPVRRVETATNGKPETNISPKSDKSSNKLKKKDGNRGFKGFFSGRKSKANEPQAKPSLPPKSKNAKSDPMAAAAARAALQSPTRAAPGQSANAEAVKGASNALRKVSTANAPPAAPEEHPAYARAGGIPNPSHPPRDDYEDGGSLSRVDTDERQEAERHFQTFDQGPLMDQPAFVPEDSSPSRVSEDTFDEGLDKAAEVKSVPSGRANGDTFDEQDEDLASEEDNRQASQDRWEQLRRTAAARAAARQSEEQSRQTDQTDGETDIEEESK